MALIFISATPHTLLKSIYTAIDAGHIATWAYDGQGDFTHTAQQWKYHAWLRPAVASGALTLGIIGRKDEKLTKEVYAIYHGRFVEMMLAHFDEKFSTGTASAQLEPPDLYKTAP